MLVKGETFNQRKAQILEDIKLSRQLITACNKCYPANKELANIVINLQQQLIKNAINELVELRKWQNKRVYDKQMANRKSY